MNLDEQIMLIEHYSKLRYSHSGFEPVLASLRELKRLREVVTVIAMNENTPLNEAAAQEFARMAREARELSDEQ